MDMLDLLEIANDFRHDKPITWAAFPPQLFNQVYSLDENRLRKARELIREAKTSLITGGDYVSLSRAKLLKHELGDIPGFSTIYSSTEGIIGLGPDSENILLSTYNYHSLLRSPNGALSELGIGKTGELVITTKMRENDTMFPLINYNTRDVVTVLGFWNGYPIVRYESRSDHVVRFGVGKLTGLILSDVVASARVKLKLGEGYFTLSQRDGIDELTFHVYKDQFSGAEEDLENFIKEELSKKEPELRYMFSSGGTFVRVSVEFVDKLQIPVYNPGQTKSRILIDQRGNGRPADR